MKSITILVPETAVPSSIVDPQYMFTAVNNLFNTEGRPAPFDVHLAGSKKQVTLSDGLFIVCPDKQLDEISHTDVIIVPAFNSDMQESLSLNKEMAKWIAKQYDQGAEIASLCTGTFLLAASGVLKGKTCSTHWARSHEFKRMFPEVNLVDEKVITEQNGIYSSGGATSYWTLLLYLVEKFTDRDTAILASKYFLLDIEKKSQSPYIMFIGQKDHEDKEVLRSQEFIEKNYKEKLTVDTISGKLGIARRTLERRFKKTTSNTVIEYIQRVKVEAAKKHLETGRKAVYEVMYDVGYNDTKAFRDVFRKLTGMSPVDYQQKYTKVQ